MMLMRRSWTMNSRFDGHENDDDSPSVNSSDDEISITNLSSKRISNHSLTQKWTYKSVDENDEKTKSKKEYNSISSDENECDERGEQDENKRLTYCYLCSIRAHVHKKTVPVPVEKRRYLRPYLNPFELERRLERQSRQLIPKIKYKFVIQTGAETNSGTTANVWFKLYGSAGVWETTQFPSTAKFTTGSQVEMILDGPLIGDLRKIRIWHNGKYLKDDWYLDFVEITCYKLNQTWRFVCDQWLSKTKSDSTSVVLSLGNHALDSEKAKNLTEYVIMIKTSTQPLVGQNLNVQFQFVCSKGQTQVFNLLSQHVGLFDPLQLDCFLVKSSHDLGKPEKLRMAHNGKKSHHEWTVESIRVLYSKDPGNFYLFKVDKWLDKNEKMNAIISMNSVVPVLSGEKQGETGKMIYHISVMTGNIRFGGTDAKVYIQFKGDKALSEVHRLHNPGVKKEFERGQIDHFHIFDRDVGKISMAKIWHDNSGSAPGWFLQAVLIKSIPTTITGREEKHDSELRDQIDRLMKKYRIRELNLEGFLSRSTRSSRKGSASSSATRSKSADEASKKEQKPRSPSVESTGTPSGTVSLKDVLKKNHAKQMSASQLSRSSPTLSILKTSSSPRNSVSGGTRKSVKFGENSTSGGRDSPKTNSPSTSKSAAPRVEMNIEWIMSVVYAAPESNRIKMVRTIENFDKSLKSIDDRLIESYNSKIKKLGKAKTESEVNSVKQEIVGKSAVSTTDAAAKAENVIYVFECNKWLAKDAGDKKIERVIKLSNVLASK